MDEGNSCERMDEEGQHDEEEKSVHRTLRELFHRIVVVSGYSNRATKVGSFLPLPIDQEAQVLQDGHHEAIVMAHHVEALDE